MGAFILLATNKAINSDCVLQLLFTVFYSCGIQRMLMKRIKGITCGILAIKRKKSQNDYFFLSSLGTLKASYKITYPYHLQQVAELGFHVGCRTTCSQFDSFPL